MTLVKEREAAQQAAEDIEDIRAIERKTSSRSEAGRRARRLRRRREQVETVRIKIAAELLGLSVPTVSKWAALGLLERREGDSVNTVSLASVLDAKPHVYELRSLGQRTGLLEAVRGRLQDDLTLADPKLRRSLEEMKRGELTTITSSDDEN